ncbi:uncharacterized protein LOC118434276 isoform X1 [Folsomia candida]|uniref:uncharacterized protein LOC118434276 isoform X1 n=1 Tax=Folsomia candida TaxID=158441 RepID=UPI001604E8B3|nr:uncharacterized protein LOC118434276 isoform X1 [Folsomia candida]
MDPNIAGAIHLQTEKLRHELVIDPRCQQLQHHDPYTMNELLEHYPTVKTTTSNNVTRSVLERTTSTATILGPGTYPIKKNSWRPLSRRRGSLENPECDIVILMIGFSLIFCLIGLILEGIAYNSDVAWNDMIKDGDPFPSLESITYFDNKKLVFDTSDQRLAEAKKLVLRDGDLEPVAIGCIVVSFFMIVLTLFMYYQGEAYKKTVVLCHIPVGAIILLASICIFVSDDQIDGDHLKAAAHLEVFLQDIMDYQEHTTFSGFTLENIEEIGIQTLNLIAVEKMCALGVSSSEGRISVTGRTTQYIYILEDKKVMRKITLDDLHTLGFCSQESYKHGAGSVLLIYFVLCYLVPLVFYCRVHGRGAAKVDDEADDMEALDIETLKFTDLPPSTFDDENVPPRTSDMQIPPLEGQYDVRAAPRPPKVPMDELLEMEYAQLSLLHKRAMEMNGDVDELSRDTSRRRSPESRAESPAAASSGKKQKDELQPVESERLYSLENKLKQLERKIARVEEEERRFHRPQSAPQNSGSNNEDSEDN